MKTFVMSLLLAMFLFTVHAEAQSPSSKTTLKIGVGNVFMGSGDMHSIQLENELEHTFTNKFSASASVSLGTSYSGVHLNTSFAHGDLRVLYAPFGNNRLVNFKVGAGLSYMYEQRVVLNGIWTIDGEKFYEISDQNVHQIGGIFSLGTDLELSDKYSAGISAYAQPYTDNVMTGISIRLGVNL